MYIDVNVYVNLYVNVNVNVYVCIYIYTYICIHTQYDEINSEMTPFFRGMEPAQLHRCQCWPAGGRRCLRARDATAYPVALLGMAGSSIIYIYTYVYIYIYGL